MWLLAGTHSSSLRGYCCLHIDIPSQPCGPISQNCEAEGNLPEPQYPDSHFERPISLEIPLQSNADAILPFVLIFNLPLWQEFPQCNEKLPTYRNYTSSD